MKRYKRFAENLLSLMYWKPQSSFNVTGKVTQTSDAYFKIKNASLYGRGSVDVYLYETFLVLHCVTILLYAFLKHLAKVYLCIFLIVSLKNVTSTWVCIYIFSKFPRRTNSPITLGVVEYTTKIMWVLTMFYLQELVIIAKKTNESTNVKSRKQNKGIRVKVRRQDKI